MEDKGKTYDRFHKVIVVFEEHGLGTIWAKIYETRWLDLSEVVEKDLPRWNMIGSKPVMIGYEGGILRAVSEPNPVPRYELGKQVSIA